MTEVRHIGSADHAWDFYGCSGEILAQDARHIERTLVNDVREAGFTVLKHVFHKFGPNGAISLLVLIEESHVAIHGAPENGELLEITIHTCCVEGTNAARSAEAKKDDVYRRWKERFRPHHIHAFPERTRGEKAVVLQEED